MAISAVLLGKRLKKARLDKGYTQEYVAEQIDLSVSHLSKIECGKKSVYVNKLAQWCDALETPIETFLVGAATPTAFDYPFSEIIKSCSQETVEDMLEICSKIAEIEKRAKIRITNNEIKKHRLSNRCLKFT